MIQYRFAAYDPNSTVKEQASNIAFLMLRQALERTQEKPERPQERGEWRRMVKLLDKIEALVHQTEDAETKQSLVRLAPGGGVLTLEDAEDDLLWRLFEAFAKTLPLASARAVAVVFDLKETRTVLE